MKTIIKIIFVSALCIYSLAYATDRDPFKPYMSTPPINASDGAAVARDAASPLAEKPLSSYAVVGVVVSPNDAMAVLKSRDKHEYFAYIGDPIGSEGGVLETINTEGITVNMGGKIVSLKVSNRFENQDEKEPEEKK
jgi:Tfp pilus assembly protein PilP